MLFVQNKEAITLLCAPKYCGILETWLSRIGMVVNRN